MKSGTNLSCQPPDALGPRTALCHPGGKKRRTCGWTSMNNLRGSDIFPPYTSERGTDRSTFPTELRTKCFSTLSVGTLAVPGPSLRAPWAPSHIPEAYKCDPTNPSTVRCGLLGWHHSPLWKLGRTSNTITGSVVSVTYAFPRHGTWVRQGIIKLWLAPLQTWPWRASQIRCSGTQWQREPSDSYRQNCLPP